jgi:hypothetical protein
MRIIIAGSEAMEFAFNRRLRADNSSEEILRKEFFYGCPAPNPGTNPRRPDSDA